MDARINALSAFIWIVLIGLVAGILARFLLPRPNSPHGFRLTAALGLGIVGALASTWSPTASEENRATVIAIFPSSTPQGVEEEIAKAHKLEFVRRLDIGSPDGRAALYRITDGRAAAEVVAALNSDVRVSAAHENVSYSLPPQLPAPVAVSGAKPSPTQRHASRPDAKPNLSDREARDANSAAILGLGQRSGLVTGKQMALRFPTADEPFVNIGGRSK